jgi:hypothetical protein
MPAQPVAVAVARTPTRGHRRSSGDRTGTACASRDDPANADDADAGVERHPVLVHSRYQQP